MKRLLVPILAALALGACASTPTVYQPAAGPRAVGYSEYQIEPGRYRITFQGGPGAPAAMVTDLAIRRAADLAVQQGFDWFRVGDRYIEGRPDRGPHLSVGVGGGSSSFGGGYYGHHSSGSAVGVGLGTSFDLSGGPAVASTIEVMMGRGARPPGADVYDARAVVHSLGAPA